MSELVLNRIPGDAGFEFGTQASPFAFTHLVLFRVGRPQKPAFFINKSLAPFRGATSRNQRRGIEEQGSGFTKILAEHLRPLRRLVIQTVEENYLRIDSLDSHLPSVKIKIDNNWRR